MEIQRRVLGGRLRVARRKARMSQGGVAAMLGVSRQSVSAWENGLFSPTAVQLADLAVAYCVSAHVLLFGQDFVRVDVRQYLAPA